MTIATMAGLQSAVADWLARSDLTIGQINECIANFEAEANRALRTRQMEGSSTLTTSSGVIALPTDYLAHRSLTWEGATTGQLEYAEPMALRGLYPSTDQGTPHLFTIEGSNIVVRPVDDTTSLTLRYWQKIPALTDPASSNWLLLAHPDVYLKGTLYYALMLLHDANAANIKILMEQGLDQIRKLSERSKAPVAIQIYGPVA